MAVLTVRNVPDEVHQALRLRAAEHGQSTEAEVREILAAAVKPVSSTSLGDVLQTIFGEVRLTDEEAELIDSARDRTPAEPYDFS